MTANKYRVLVVDDNRDAAESIGELLALDGFEVATCYDGVDALESVSRFRPDACVLDINMPGMNGYELAQRIRSRYPTNPPVFATLTAYGDYAHLEKAVEAGFDLQFTKPVNHQELAEQLAETVRKGEPGDDRSVLRRLLTRVLGAWSRPEAK